MSLKQSIKRILREETSTKQRARDMVKKIGFLKSSKMVGGLEELHKIIDLKGTQGDMRFIVESILNHDLNEKICNFRVSDRFGSLDILVNIPELYENSDWRNRRMELESEHIISSFIYNFGNGKVKGHRINVSAVRC